MHSWQKQSDDKSTRVVPISTLASSSITGKYLLILIRTSSAKTTQDIISCICFMTTIFSKKFHYWTPLLTHPLHCVPAILSIIADIAGPTDTESSSQWTPLTNIFALSTINSASDFARSLSFATTATSISLAIAIIETQQLLICWFEDNLLDIAKLRVAV